MLNAPIARKIPKELIIHGDTRIDNYYWLNERDNQEVIDYLNAENAYLDEQMGHTKPLQEELYKEIVARFAQTDMTVPYKYNGYYYITRYEEGHEYPIHSRKEGSLEVEEEIMLHVPELAKGFSYYAIGGRAVSPDNKWLAYGVDTVSRRIYTIFFKNLVTGEILFETLENTTGSCVWANDNKTVFYNRKDESLRSYKIFKHTVGTDPALDECIWHETDETYGCFVYKTKSEKYLIIGSYSTLSNEYRILEADNPHGEFRLFEARERKHEFSVNHAGDTFYIVTNWESQNFKLMTCSELDPTTRDNWKDLIPHRPDTLLEGLDIFKDYLVLSERHNGLTQLQVLSTHNQKAYFIPFKEAVYMAYTGLNPDFDSETLRMGYTSLTTPSTVYDFNMKTQEWTLLKQEAVLDASFKPENYHAERLYATAADGVKVPISLVYNKKFGRGNDLASAQQAPLLLYGYGSYGHSIDPFFSSPRLSLLDRGFIFAIAHIRGGQELGRQWYEDGKFLKKKNTFTDYIACAEHLITEGYTTTDMLFGQGGSAGGLLMGAVINLKPEIWKGIIAQVPFVDVVTTMLDESIPLTTGEFDEWGNPKDETYYHYMKSYSPYDNVEPKAYPAMLVTTGLHDSQVQYWEPAKWVAKLRTMKTDKNPLYMYCNMDTGHGGASGRFERYKETAKEWAFFLDLAGKLQK